MTFELKVAEKPEKEIGGRIYRNHNNSTAYVWPLFASDTILVLKEEMAYPLSSFVAECGGVLGLFLGFNFMMIWDWIQMFLLKFFLPSVIRNSFYPQNK